MKNWILLLVLITSVSSASAQIFNPVSWEYAAQHNKGDEFSVEFAANIDKGWAVYSQFLENDDGPVATSITFENEGEGYSLIGPSDEGGHKKEGFDDLFEMNVIKFYDKYTITQKIKGTIGTVVKGYLTYMTCDDERCLPPKDIEFSFTLAKAAITTDKNQEEPQASTETFEIEDASGEDLFQPLDLDMLSDDSGIVDPVKWSASFEGDAVVFEANIDDGWYIYDQQIEGEGPEPTEFVIAGKQQILPMEAEDASEGFDHTFEINIKKIKKKARYTYIIRDDNIVNVSLNYMACDKEKCIFPKPVHFEIDPTAKSVSIADNIIEPLTAEDIAGIYPLDPIDLNAPLGECGDEHLASIGGKSLFNIFLLGFFGGLLALLTPCVFPMIPLTVSFFTKGSENKKAGVRKAILYGFFILLVYLLLSIPFHLLDSVNPGILNSISTNIYLNIFFFVIFVFFAFSFFGYYELTIPSSWTNRVSNAESVGGVVGIFFMALTLALVSFSCTGPILGSLLAGALTSEGGAIQLTSGMAGFGLALALPFALFAAFPSMLSSLPKSGGWLNTVKVTLGFLELALAFKFLSNADLVKHWGLLKLEPFLIIWIAIFLGLAIYLFGRIRFPHDSPGHKPSFLRIATGALSLAFAVYLVSGFSVNKDKGTFRSLKLLSGLAPPVGYSWLYPKECPNNLDCFKDLEKGLAYAKKMDKPVMIDFTGHACVNCRKMEEHVWPEEEIIDKLQNDLVLISLYVDEKIELPPEEQTEHWKTYGEKWERFQSTYFNNNSQPLYVLLTPDGKLLNNPVGYTPDVGEYNAFLECGLSAYETLKGKNQLGVN